MFNIGPTELIIILLVALLVVGPSRLPEMGRTIGKGLREFRRATDEVKYSFEASLEDEPESTNGDRSKDPGRPTRPGGRGPDDDPE